MRCNIRWKCLCIIVATSLGYLTISLLLPFSPRLQGATEIGNPFESEIRIPKFVVKPGSGSSWKEVVGDWNPKYKVEALTAAGEVLNPYPDQVQFHVNEEGGCQNTPLVLALVVTAVANEKRRHFIRNTWGHPSLVSATGIKPLFVVGQTLKPSMQQTVESESTLHHDILQANFLDSYYNLTYKTTAILRWASHYCPNAPFLLKIDDDVIPNPIALRDFVLAYLKENPQPKRIMGKVRCCDPVLREGKWAVPTDIYEGHSYPTYVAGPSYMLPSAIIPQLLQGVRGTRFLYLEDVYTTGLAARTAGLKHQSILTLTSIQAEKMDYLWSFGYRVFQENVGWRDAIRGWNNLLQRENITDPPPYSLADFISF